MNRKEAARFEHNNWLFPTVHLLSPFQMGQQMQASPQHTPKCCFTAKCPLSPRPAYRTCTTILICSSPSHPLRLFTLIQAMHARMHINVFLFAIHDFNPNQLHNRQLAPQTYRKKRLGSPGAKCVSTWRRLKHFDTKTTTETQSLSNSTRISYRPCSRRRRQRQQVRRYALKPSASLGTRHTFLLSVTNRTCLRVSQAPKCPVLSPCIMNGSKRLLNGRTSTLSCWT